MPRSLTRIFLLLLSALPCHANPRPNIVVFLVDDLGVMDTSVPFMTDSEGLPERHPLNDFYRTPAMERLAAQGIRFNQFNAMSVCSPSRTTLMNGQNPARHRTTNWINPDRNNAASFGPGDWNWHGLQPGHVSLASLLRENGHATAHVGKAHFGPRNTPGGDPANLGFDHNIAGASFGSPGSYYANEDFGRGKRANYQVPHLEAYHGSGKFLTEVLTLESLKLLDQLASQDRPFFLHLSHYAVHTPFQADPRFVDHYKDSGKAPPAIAYATLVEGMDKSLGDVLDHLDRLGIAEQTLVMFLGDNGGDAPLGPEHAVGSSAPLRGKKATHYEGGMRTPFIVSWAKRNADHPLQQALRIPAGAIEDTLVSIEDIFPTLLQLTGTQPPDGHVIDGQALQPMLTGGAEEHRRAKFLMHYPHDHRSSYWSALRDQDWKVIYHYQPGKENPDGRYQLFHLAEDPSEQTNLASERPEKLREMMQRLIAELESHDALYPKDKAGNELRPQLP